MGIRGFGSLGESTFLLVVGILVSEMALLRWMDGGLLGGPVRRVPPCFGGWFRCMFALDGTRPPCWWQYHYLLLLSSDLTHYFWDGRTDGIAFPVERIMTEVLFVFAWGVDVSFFATKKNLGDTGMWTAWFCCGVTLLALPIQFLYPEDLYLLRTHAWCCAFMAMALGVWCIIYT